MVRVIVVVMGSICFQRRRDLVVCVGCFSFPCHYSGPFCPLNYCPDDGLNDYFDAHGEREREREKEKGWRERERQEGVCVEPQQEKTDGQSLLLTH